jgi:hypothetical protein
MHIEASTIAAIDRVKWIACLQAGDLRSSCIFDFI